MGDTILFNMTGSKMLPEETRLHEETGLRKDSCYLAPDHIKAALGSL